MEFEGTLNLYSQARVTQIWLYNMVGVVGDFGVCLFV